MKHLLRRRPLGQQHTDMQIADELRRRLAAGEIPTAPDEVSSLPAVDPSPMEGSPAWHAIHHNGRVMTRDWKLITRYAECDWDVCVEYREWETGNKRVCVDCGQPVLPAADARYGYRHASLLAEHDAQVTPERGDRKAGA